MVILKLFIEMRKLTSLTIGLLLVLSSCGPKHDQAALDMYFENNLANYNRELTGVIVADIFTPPVASRIYAYPNIAAYEGIRLMDSRRPSLAGQLNGLENLPQPDSGKSYYYPLVSMVAFTSVAKSLVYDLERVEKIQNQMLQEVQDIGIDKVIYNNSISYGNTLAQEILNWASKDGYLRRTALPRYSVNDDPGRWRPTPPDYMDAIEPHWNSLRPFVLDSVSQFDPGLPTPFDSDEESQIFSRSQGSVPNGT